MFSVSQLFLKILVVRFGVPVQSRGVWQTSWPMSWTSWGICASPALGLVDVERKKTDMEGEIESSVRLSGPFSIYLLAGVAMSWERVVNKRSKRFAFRGSQRNPTVVPGGVAGANQTEAMALAFLKQLFSGSMRQQPQAQPRAECTFSACGCSSWADRSYRCQCRAQRPAA